MKVKIKKLDPSAVIPTYSKPGDAGLDLTAISCHVEWLDEKSGDLRYVEYGTGLSIEIPEGYVGLLFPRSSISNTPLILANSVGVIDSSYRGEVKARFKMRLTGGEGYDIYERIAQLIILPYPQIEFEEVEELAGSERSAGGFGSTGTK